MACPTTYSESLLGGLATQLRDAVVSHFENSEFSQPAQLVVERSTKRYPLYQVGVELEFSVQARNLGNGPASSVVIEIEHITDNVEVTQPQVYVGRVGGQEQLAILVGAKVLAGTELAMASGQAAVG